MEKTKVTFKSNLIESELPLLLVTIDRGIL